MAKALTPIVIVLLLLSIGSLVLGLQLFGKREVLKGRVQQTEQALAKIASNIGYTGFDVAALAAEDSDGLTRLQGPLNQLAAAAQVQYTELQDAKQDIETVRQDLLTTKDELDRAVANLDQARAQVDTLNATINETKAKLSTRDEEMARLQSSENALNLKIEDLNNELAQAEDSLRDAEDKIVTLEQSVQMLESELGQGQAASIRKGLTGRVLFVSPDWNFIVIDLGSQDGLVPNTEMLIHRNDSLVGKIIVSNLSPDMSIAELESGWLQAEVKEGDFVVF